jgi:prepilin-type N-terminal cleavage/methylation domain-containing protein
MVSCVFSSARLVSQPLYADGAPAPRPQVWSRRRIAAFTLVEIMVTITIISLLAAIMVPSVQRVKRRTVATAVANDLRTFAAAFDTYAHETGGWPAEVAAGVFPPEMASRINSTAWQRPTPIGGQYNWDNNQTHYGTKYRAVIQISDTAAVPLLQDVELWEAVDRVIDDGNLATGNFRLGANDEPIFIVSP